VSNNRPLLVFPGALGDLVCFEPALAAIAERSGARPHLLCKGDLVPLVVAADIATAEPIEGRRSSWLFSPSPPPEAADFFTGFGAIECFTGAGEGAVAENLARWQGEHGRVHAFRPPPDIHLVDHFHDAVGAVAAARRDPRLALGDAIRRDAARDFPGCVNTRPLLVVHPGSGGKHKRFSRQGFAVLAKRWQKSGGAALVVLGPVERDEEAWWNARSPDVWVTPNLIATAALLGACDAYLGNDSGVSHLAAALGARGIAVFGPTDPACWRPRGAHFEAVAPGRWSALDDDASSAALASIESALEHVLRAGFLDNSGPRH
jgi:heptosyltransferase-3